LPPPISCQRFAVARFLRLLPDIWVGHVFLCVLVGLLTLGLPLNTLSGVQGGRRRGNHFDDFYPEFSFLRLFSAKICFLFYFIILFAALDQFFSSISFGHELKMAERIFLAGNI
jgi:hypothetical protein